MMQRKTFSLRSIGPSVLVLVALGLGVAPMARAETTAPPNDASPTVHWLDGTRIKLGFDADGNLTIVHNRRFEEDVLGTPFIPSTAISFNPPSLPPPLAPALRVVPIKAPYGPVDPTGWIVHADVTKDRAQFIATDPKGVWLPAGFTLTRTYHVVKDYDVDVDVALANGSRKAFPSTTGSNLEIVLGPIIPPQQHIPEVFSGKSDASVVRVVVKAEPMDVTTDAAWIGVRSNFYAWILDPRGAPGRFTAWQPKIVDRANSALTGAMIGFKPARMPAPGATLAVHLGIYAGPKEAASLGERYRHVFNNWDAWYGGIGQWMFWLLQFLHAITGSYGLSILLLTFGVKLALHPLSVTQTRSMLKMQELKPKLDELKNRYKDPNQFQQETMRLYKENNVNPLGGCFPMMLQIPIFIALYGCLSGAIQLKGVPFLWLPDLSSPDPTFMLPILFALTMYLSSRGMQQAQPGQDQATAAMMGKVMPILMLFLMRKVAGGVMLYLSGQTLLSTVEQKITQAQLKREAAATPPPIEPPPPEPTPPPPPPRRAGKKGRSKSAGQAVGS